MSWIVQCTVSVMCALSLYKSQKSSNYKSPLILNIVTQHRVFEIAPCDCMHMLKYICYIVCVCVSN
jgi:hypothetical protein